MANYELSLSSAVLPGTTPAVSLTAGVLSTLATAAPGWIVANGPASNASGSQLFALWKQQQQNFIGNPPPQGGLVQWSLAGLISASKPQSLTVSTLTSIAPAVGDLVLAYDATCSAMWCVCSVVANNL